MKRNNKKGFTIVELVIVIAVIAILAAVLIPTFSGIVKKANNSSIQQETRAALTVILAEENGQLSSEATYYFLYKTKDGVEYFKAEDGKVVADNETNVPKTLDNNDVIWYAKDNTTIVADLGLTVTDMTTDNQIGLEDLENVVVVKSVNGTAPVVDETPEGEGANNG